MTCAVVVTYNPDLKQFLEYFKLNVKEVDYTIIVDNSTDIEIRKKLHTLMKEENSELIQLKDNKGIAYAQNIGIKKAISMHCYNFILFLDQDSLLNKDTINIYKKYYIKLSDQKNIAALGIGNMQTDKSEYKEVEQIISSGTFSPVSVFKDIGYFDESLFIDFVEYDWCWRANEKGYRIFSIKEVYLTHMHGNGKMNFLGISFVLPSNFRLYYQYRNFLFLLHQSYVPLKWKVKMFIKMLIKIPIYILLLPNRLKTAKYIFFGLKDYLLNQKGRYK